MRNHCILEKTSGRRAPSHVFCSVFVEDAKTSRNEINEFIFSCRRRLPQDVCVQRRIGAAGARLPLKTHGLAAWTRGASGQGSAAQVARWIGAWRGARAGCRKARDMTALGAWRPARAGILAGRSCHQTFERSARIPKNQKLSRLSRCTLPLCSSFLNRLHIFLPPFLFPFLPSLPKSGGHCPSEVRHCPSEVRRCGRPNNVWASKCVFAVPVHQNAFYAQTFLN